MHVFMDRHRIVLADDVLHDDVVALAALGVIGEGEFIDPVGLILLLAAKGDDPDREFRGALRRTGLHEKAAHLFEIEDSLAALFLAGGGEKLEMGSGDFHPLIGGAERKAKNDRENCTAEQHKLSSDLSQVYHLYEDRRTNVRLLHRRRKVLVDDQPLAAALLPNRRVPEIGLHRLAVFHLGGE